MSHNGLKRPRSFAPESSSSRADSARESGQHRRSDPVTKLQQQLASLERSGSEEVTLLHGKCSEFGQKVASLEEEFTLGAEQFRRLEQAVAKSEAQFSDQLQRMEQAIGAIEAQFSEGRRTLETKPGEKLFVALQARLTKLEASLANTASVAQLDIVNRAEQKLSLSLKNVEDTIVELSRLTHASEQNIDQLTREMKSSRSTPRAARGEDIQELRNDLRHLQSSIMDVSESGKEQLKRLHDVTNDLHARLDANDRQIRNKADATKVSDLCDAVQDAQAGLQEVEQALTSGKATSKEAGLDAERMKVLEKVVEEKVDIDELQEVFDAVMELKQELADMGRPVQDDRGSDRTPQLSGSIASMQAQIGTIIREADGKANTEDLRELREAIVHIESKLSSVQKLVQESTGHSKQAQHVRDELVALNLKCANLETAVEQKVESKEVQALKEAVSIVQARETSGSGDRSRLQQLEGAIAGLRRELANVERSLQGKADVGQMPLIGAISAGGSDDFNLQTQLQLQQVKSSVTMLEQKLADYDHALQEKACQSQVQSFRRTLGTLELRFGQYEQSLQEKAEHAQLQQLRTSISTFQAQLSAQEQNICEKVGAEEFAEVKTCLAALRSQLAAGERAAHDKASAAQVQQLRSTVMAIETKVAGVEQSVQDKASSGQLTRLQSGLETLQTKLTQTAAQDRARVGSGRLHRLSLSAGPAAASSMDENGGLSLGHWPKFQASRLSLPDRGNDGQPTTLAPGSTLS
eukprot:TRINITY_DN55190_c0_g1_i1.p1 TRINITY_DN55190_c0_g1~~TRINITY_DN55190_c0_g1_i1.p1  ORF type:complete len:772 (-),score=205.92 TRINITY_DN55190_c0_g1_i1:44-2299(-)